MLRKVCSFVAILLAASLLLPEARAATKSPCATEGPFSLRPDAIFRIGLVPVETGPPEELQAFVRAEIVRWGEVVRRSGATVE